MQGDFGGGARSSEKGGALEWRRARNQEARKSEPNREPTTRCDLLQSRPRSGVSPQGQGWLQKRRKMGGGTVRLAKRGGGQRRASENSTLSSSEEFQRLHPGGSLVGCWRHVENHEELSRRHQPLQEQ